jgi:hypothetical protein
MLNKCRCGGDARLHTILDRWFAVCVSSTCVRTAWGNSDEDAQSNWNSENSGPVTPPEDFEDRFAQAFSGSICSLTPPWVSSDEVLATFKNYFGFDLKEVAKEQWAKENLHET